MTVESQKHFEGMDVNDCGIQPYYQGYPTIALGWFFLLHFLNQANPNPTNSLAINAIVLYAWSILPSIHLRLPSPLPVS